MKKCFRSSLHVRSTALDVQDGGRPEPPVSRSLFPERLQLAGSLGRGPSRESVGFNRPHALLFAIGMALVNRHEQLWHVGVGQKHDIATKSRVRYEGRRRQPVAPLQQPDAERDRKTIEPAQIHRISGDNMAALIDLQHDLVDDPCQRIETLWVAISAPVEQARNTELAAAGSSAAQIAKAA